MCVPLAELERLAVESGVIVKAQPKGIQIFSISTFAIALGFGSRFRVCRCFCSPNVVRVLRIADRFRGGASTNSAVEVMRPLYVEGRRTGHGRELLIVRRIGGVPSKPCKESAQPPLPPSAVAHSKVALSHGTKMAFSSTQSEPSRVWVGTGVVGNSACVDEIIELTTY